MEPADVNAVAVYFLHAFANPSNDHRAAEILRWELPDAFINVSSEIIREFGEYEPINTAVTNSYVGPVNL